MKTYPSIPGPKKAQYFKGYIFQKLDGSNIRIEWSKKHGWHKFGTRRRLLSSENDPIMYNEVMNTFHREEAEFNKLAKIFKEQRWQKVTAFFEFWGEHSFAGVHVPGEYKNLTLIDVAPYKEGLLGPKDFLKLFGDCKIPRFLGIMNFNPELIRKVYNEELEGAGLEGIVAKAGKGHSLIMAKAKTKEWIDEVKARYSNKDADTIINS